MGGAPWQRRGQCCVANSPASTLMSWSTGRSCGPGSIGACSGCWSRRRSACSLSGLFNYPDYLGTNLETDLRQAAAGARQRRHLRRLFLPLHRRMLLSGAAPVRRAGAMAAMERPARLGLEHHHGGGAHLADVRREPRPRSGRVSAVRQDPALHRRAPSRPRNS